MSDVILRLANKRGGEASQYVAVAASQSTVNISFRTTSSTGADYLETLTVVPATSAAGAVTLFDGSTSVMAIPALSGGNGVPNPYTLYLGMRAQTRWVITTGANVSILAVGSFK